jgi:hypothetical protein
MVPKSSTASSDAGYMPTIVPVPAPIDKLIKAATKA